MRGVLVAAALLWAAALSLAGHPALAAAAAGPDACCGTSAHEDGYAAPAQVGLGAIRSARCERRATGGGSAILDSPASGAPPTDVDEVHRAPGALAPRPSLVTSVTRAPRAPPRS